MSKANRPSRKPNTVKIINTDEDSFVDFGNLNTGIVLPADPVEVIVSARPSSAKGSRFATVANADVVNIKRIHDGLVLGEMTEAIGTDATQCPKFYAMDLARTMNRVLVSLNLRPSTEDDGPFRAYAPNSKSVPELQSTIQVQQELLNELGKNLDYILKYNAQLVELNKTLVQERTIAYQTRDDLHQLLIKEKNKKKTEVMEQQQVVSEAQKSRERAFFDDGLIIDQAFAEFKRKAFPTESSVEVRKAPENIAQEVPNDIEPWRPGSPKEQIQFAADMASVQKEYEPPSTVLVGNHIESSHSRYLALTSQNPYRAVRVGKPKLIHSGNYYPAKFQYLTQRISNYISHLTSVDIQRNKEFMEAKSIEEYLTLIQRRMEEVSQSFGECLDILAEEQRNGRQWKLRYTKLEKDHKDLLARLEKLHLHQGARFEHPLSMMESLYERPRSRLPLLAEDITKIDLIQGKDAKTETPHTDKNTSARIFIPSIRLGLPLNRHVPPLPPKILDF
jgi:hypothetical protein